jgi:hypothetical protein
MEKQNEAASEPIARYDELPILRTYKVALEAICEIGGFWVVGQDKNLYHVEMPDKVKECMRKNAKRYDIQTGKVMGYNNADRIRAMTDEELAWELCRIIRMPFYKDDGEIDAYEVDCWAKWLKQEASK